MTTSTLAADRRLIANEAIRLIANDRSLWFRPSNVAKFSDEQFEYRSNDDDRYTEQSDESESAA